MALYMATNQWGGPDAPWHRGGIWALGNRPAQAIVSILIRSEDHGYTLEGEITYQDEGPIGFKATLMDMSAQAENIWCGDESPWGDTYPPISYFADDEEKTSDMSMSTENTSPYTPMEEFDCKPMWLSGNTYWVENQWGGPDAPWQDGGYWVIGGRSEQKVIALDISSSDDGDSLFGTMTYDNEGPIGFAGFLK